MDNAEAVWGADQRGTVVTGFYFPDYCAFQNLNVLAAHLFHALSAGKTMGGLDVTQPRAGATLMSSGPSFLD